MLLVSVFDYVFHDGYCCRYVFFFKQKTAYEMRISDWSSDVCSSDLEWGSRRIDLAILGLFFTPAIVGIYYVAQQVASLPQKLKTSFDPILGPVITRNLAKNDKKAVAAQIAQVGFWIIAAQTGEIGRAHV